MHETFGQRMRRARNERGWSLEKLAKKSGIFINTIIGYELDQHEPGIFRAACFADALGVSLDWLVGRSEDDCMKMPDRNAPMTLEELERMSGKFVFIVPGGMNPFVMIRKPELVGIYGPVVAASGDKWFTLYNQNGAAELAKAKDYLHTWTAYRSRPEGLRA